MQLFESFLAGLLGDWALGRSDIHIVVLRILEFWFADIAFPTNRMAIFYRLLDMLQQFVDRNIEKLVMHLVVGYLE